MIMDVHVAILSASHCARCRICVKLFEVVIVFRTSRPLIFVENDSDTPLRLNSDVRLWSRLSEAVCTSLNGTFGTLLVTGASVWFQVYQADVRCRDEHMEFVGAVKKNVLWRWPQAWCTRWIDPGLGIGSGGQSRRTQIFGVQSRNSLHSRF